MTKSEADIIKDLKRDAAREGLCDSIHKFSLGGNNEAITSCGLPPGHVDAGISKVHTTRMDSDDGSSVVFRWL